MARKGVAGAIAGIGHALMRREDIEREDSLLDREEARHDELLTRQEKREDLMMQRQEAIARAREVRQDLMRAAEREDDRGFQRELADEQMAHQEKLNEADNELVSRRLDDSDRRSVEDAATSQIAALDERIVELQDMALKGEVLGQEGEVERQLKEAEDQKLAIRSRLVERLYEMGDARYKDMPTDQRLYAAGYSKDQVARFMRLAEGAASEEAPEEAPAARSDEQIGQDLLTAEATTGRDSGLSPEDRAALGLDPAMGLPQSPPPLRDMSHAGRGRKLPTVTGRGGAQVTDVADLFRMRPDPRPKQTAPARGKRE